MKKVMDITEKIKLVYSISGILFVLVGVFAFLEAVGTMTAVFSFAEVICLVIVIMCSVKVLKVEKCISDEMSEENLLRAKAITYDLGKIIVIMGTAVLAVMNLFDTNVLITGGLTDLFRPVLFILIGMFDISVGYFFKKYEEE